MTDTATPRYNIYSHIHRALRREMSTVLVDLGRTDANDPAQLDRSLAALEGLLALCEAHLAHEDQFLHPAMEARRPGSAYKTQADHQHHVSAIAALRREAERLSLAATGCRAVLLESLYHHVSAFVAENFEHMLVEESYNNAVLWDSYSDAEIQGIEAALVASLPPEENARVLALMMPAISAPERERLLGHIRAEAPPAAFSGLLGLLLPAVPEAERGRLAAAFV